MLLLFIIFRLLALLRQAIVVGDVTIEPAIEWEVASVSITFHKTSAAAPQPSRFAPKPEIAHEFRQPEARPPVVVSLAFTAIVLVPGVVLLGLWVAIGANISNFPWTDLNALVFHVALGGVLLLLAPSLIASGKGEALSWIIMAHMLCYMPTLALSNTVAFTNIDDRSKFPALRVWGTIGWIVAGLVVGGLGLSSSPKIFMIGGISGSVLGALCFLMPATPPP